MKRLGDIKYSFRRNTPLCHILCLTDFGPRSLTITYQQKLVSNNFSLSSFQLENLIQCLLYNVTFCTTYMYYTFCWMQHQSKEFFFFISNQSRKFECIVSSNWTLVTKEISNPLKKHTEYQTKFLLTKPFFFFLLFIIL